VGNPEIIVRNRSNLDDFLFESTSGFADVDAKKVR
jgi:hypothetical protein